MDWTTILVALIGGGSIGGWISSIYHRKSSKKIKESEATQSDVEAQKSEIDLANKYRDEMLNMIKMVKDANEKNFTNQDEIIRRLGKLDERIEKLETNYGYMQEYLNGGYHEFLADKQSRHNPKINPNGDISEK